jgi:hypothetical protein
MKGVLNVHRLMIAMETAKNDFFLCFVKRYLDSRLRQRTFLINIMQNSQKWPFVVICLDITLLDTLSSECFACRTASLRRNSRGKNELQLTHWIMEQAIQIIEIMWLVGYDPFHRVNWTWEICYYKVKTLWSSAVVWMLSVFGGEGFSSVWWVSY